VLAVFNMFPLPPLDGGRIAVGLLPNALASPLARLEPYGMPILIGLLFILPMLGAQFGVDLSIVSRVIASSTDVIIGVILRLTGNTWRNAVAANSMERCGDGTYDKSVRLMHAPKAQAHGCNLSEVIKALDATEH
jgi:Zn-dependent protease